MKIKTKNQNLGDSTEGDVKWQPTPVLLPGESYGGRSLVGYSPWGRKELDTTERLHFSLSTKHPASENKGSSQISDLSHEFKKLENESEIKNK